MAWFSHLNQALPFSAAGPDLKMSRDAIVEWLTAHQHMLLTARTVELRPLKPDGTSGDQRGLNRQDNTRLSARDRQVIDHHAGLINRCHNVETGLNHLISYEVKKLGVLRDGVRLARVTPEDSADVMAGQPKLYGTSLSEGG